MTTTTPRTTDQVVLRRTPEPLNRAHLGQRVVVRHRLGNGSATDVLGELTGLDERALTVRDRHGLVHQIEQRAVIAAKPVPPAPTRRAYSRSASGDDHAEPEVRLAEDDDSVDPHSGEEARACPDEAMEETS